MELIIFLDQNKMLLRFYLWEVESKFIDEDKIKSFLYIPMLCVRYIKISFFRLFYLGLV